MLKAPVITSFMQEDDELVGGGTDVNLVDGNVPGPVGSDGAGAGTSTTATLADGTYSFTAAAMASSGEAGAGAMPIVVSVDTAAQSSSTVNAAPVTVADGATVEIDGVSGQPVTFAGATGTLILENAVGFTGQVSGLSGSDALDLSDVSYSANTTATFSGNANGGTLTITDGAHTANVALVGNYLSSNWDLSSDGNGGTIVVDPVASNNWQTLDVGAGGFVTGIDIAPNDTMVVRTDTYGAYIWNGSAWQQLVTSTSMPAAFVTPNDSQGVYEIQIAPSNTNVLYMMYEGYVFKSTNEGTTWTETSFAPVTENPNDAYRMDGQKMAIDPENPNVVYVGTPQNGLFVTTNGGVTWQSVSAVPVSQTDGDGDYPGITGIDFDPALGVTGGITDTIFAASYGNGVYESTNGGASWSAIGGPSEVEYAAVSSTGVYYVISNGNSLWDYKGGVWTELLSDTSGIELETVAVDPFNPQEIVTQNNAGELNISYNGGETWSGRNYGNQLIATDIPWLAGASTNSGQGQWLDIGGTVFDQLVPNELWISDGTGVFNTTNLPTENFTTHTPVIWDDQSIGIEQLVANEIVVPPGGDPVLASWDRPFFYINNANAYPSTYGPIESGTIVAGWSVDYASSDPSFLVGIADWWGTEESGYSTNGGQSWTAFPSFLPGAGSTFIGGTIAASSPTNIIWAPAGGFDPYYTLNGGETWNPITLPGVSNWSGLDPAYYLDARTVTADRVLPNTFYLYYAGEGVYETTNGGSTWTQVYSGQISPYSWYNAEFESVPGEAGNLFFTGGPQSSFPSEGFYRSTNQGATWIAVPNVTEVNCFGFGAPAPGQSYPSIYIVGYVNSVYGIWQSINNAQSWTQIGTYPTSSLDQIKTISGDPNTYGQVYVGFEGSGYAYLPASDPATGPTLTSLVESPSSGDLDAGKTVTLTLSLSEVVTVAGGTPTLTLNDGGTATYAGGSGTDALTFSYTVAAGQNIAGLAATAVNLNSATVTDSGGNAANLSLTDLTQAGPQIDTTAPTITSIVESPSSGDLNAGKVVMITLDMSEVVTVNTSGGSPTLTLNDGGTATYVSGSGTNALTFGYTVLTGQNTPDLMETAVNLNGATITDSAGNAANLSLAGLPQGSPQIDTTTPTVSSLVESPSSGDLDAGKTVTLTLTLSDAVTVAGGTPTLTLNDGGTATYTSGSGTDALTFSYTVAAGQNISDLKATAVNLKSATVTDGAGNAANLSLTGLTQTGPQIDTTPPAAPVILGDTVIGTNRLTLNGTAEANSTVTLFDGATQLGTAAANASGTWSFTTGTLAAGANSFTATDTDAAGNASAVSSALVVTVGVSTDNGPTVSSVVESPASGDLDAGKTITLTLTLSEVVTVAGGTPTLTLNDGGTATYTGGSGTDALTFRYTVAAGQNTTSLSATVVNLNSATVTDGAGNAANLSLTGLTQTGPQIDTTLPPAPVILGDKVEGNRVILNGTAEANTTVTVYEGATKLGTTSVNASAVWSFTTPSLGYGSHTFTATDTDAAGNISAASQPIDPTISAPAGAAPVIVINAVDGTDTSSFTVAAQQSVAISSLFTISNPSGDSITEYSFEDNGGGSGYFTLAGTVEPNGQVFTVSASDLNSVQYVGGSSAGTDTLTVDAYDATIGAWISSASLSAVTAATFPLANANDTTIPAVAVEASMYGAVGSSAEITLLATQFLPAQVAWAIQNGFSPEVFACQVLGLALAFGNENGATTFANNFGPSNAAMPATAAGDAAFAAAAANAIFGSAQNAGTATNILGWVSYFEAYFTQNGIVGIANPTAAQIDLAARGTAWGDAVGVAVANNLGPLSGLVANFLEDAAQGTAVYSASLSSQPGAAGASVVTTASDVQVTGNAPATIANGTVLEINTPDSGTVTFAGSTGTLWLDQPSTFTGTVSGFSGRDGIDLPGIAFGAGTTLGYLPNSNQTEGTLSLTDGTHSANIALLGNYMASSFVMESDNQGGTMVVPEASQTSTTLLTTSQHA